MIRKKLGKVIQSEHSSSKSLKEAEAFMEGELSEDQRIEFENEYTMNTNGIAYSTNLVQGQQVEIYSENGRITKLSYLETMLIPAASGEIKIVNKGKGPCKMVLVYVKPEIGISVPLNDPL